jgi:phosphatidylglycerol:prolipoprotein diacylglycerol transferase
MRHMADCYVFTAFTAVAGSRVLYILTNLSEFPTLWSMLKLRSGGLVAYGGFLGGYLGSWAFLARHRIRLMPWADVAVPSLASGLLITRIGCYLYGCDFGTRLTDSAPALLKKVGTFPKLAEGTLGYFENGVPIPGSPAYAHHLDLCTRGIYKAADCVALKDASFPVHPTQIYESAVGAVLLVVLLLSRKHQKFRGQQFLIFVFGYGFLRFLLELVRDDSERGSLPFHADRYVLVSLGLAAMAIAFVVGFSKSIANPSTRTAARVAAFVPAVVAFFAYKTGPFEVDDYAYSTSQFIGLASAVAAGVFFGRFWDEAKRAPKLAMALGLGESEASDAPAPRKKRKADEDGEDKPSKKKAKKPAAAEAEPAPEGETAAEQAPADAVPRPAPTEDDGDSDDEG